ncbi:Hemolysin-type calcium-binding repeat-containing protein [Roseivivax marinus]|uniref:calcium-binding protein n=1 Tax=Roseivivax marinus TaxID=1379903 RepID=UPI0008B4D199|nr:calcium-binding protein [Roseivivax marinus]SEK98982.1 Hemolysin-type calcium-binding repeat-containing protein [Roseivivax marinus]
MDLHATNVSAWSFKSDLFGGNIIAHRDSLNFGSLEELAGDLGVTNLRYPGGSLTEYYFDISQPDAATATHRESGEIVDFVSLSSFAEMASEIGASATIVIPTARFLSVARDPTGNRRPSFDETELREFVRDTLTGEYGPLLVDAFEIGNEYWGSGQMSAREYGRLAGEMAVIINDEIAQINSIHGWGMEPDVVIQVGANHSHSDLREVFRNMPTEQVLQILTNDYGVENAHTAANNDGSFNWGILNNLILLSELQHAGAEAAVSGVVFHLYSKEPDLPNQREYNFWLIDTFWKPVFAELAIYVSEWNVSGVTGFRERGQDYGLFQASEMIQILEEMASRDVVSANVWPLLQNTANALSYGRVYDGLSFPGAVYAELSGRLEGFQALDLTPGDGEADEVEMQTDGYNLHAYVSENALELVLFSSGEGSRNVELDLSAILSNYDASRATSLAYLPGEAIGDSSASFGRSSESGWSDPGDLSVSHMLMNGEAVFLSFEGAVFTPAIASQIINVPVSPDPWSESSDGQHLVGGENSDLVHGHEGDDRIYGQAGNDTLDGGPGADTIAGSHGADVLRGGEGNDSLGGGAGHDSITAGYGSDTVGGGQDNDTVLGGSGNDVVAGGAGNDSLHGDDHSDEIGGGAGDDWVSGDAGHDNLGGGYGNDTLYGSSGHDRIGGGTGADLIFGGSGNDFLAGGSGRDELWGGNEDDTLNGGNGDDTLIGGGGADVFLFNEGPGIGHDRIEDFEMGVDLIRFAGIQRYSLDISHSGRDLLIETGSGSVTLVDLGPATLDEILV